MVLASIGVARLTTIDSFTAILLMLSGIVCESGAVLGRRGRLGLGDDKLVGARRRMKQDQHRKWVMRGFFRDTTFPARRISFWNL